LRTDPVAGLQSLLVTKSDNLRTTYSAAVTFAPAATPTDIATISGSATKVIRVTRIELSGIATTAQTQIVQLIKRSAANTGGTTAAMIAVPLDVDNAAATATVVNYTANPTALGAAIGTLRRNETLFPLSGTPSNYVSWEFGTRNNQPITLRAATQILAIALNGTTIAGGSISLYIEWTEDAS